MPRHLIRLMTVVVLFTLIAWGDFLCGASPRLSPKSRRVIYNDDADTRLLADGKENFLAMRFNRVLNTDVDTYFLNVHTCFDKPDTPGLGDANQITIDAARENNLEIWASFRMNDTHDAHWPTTSDSPDKMSFEKDAWKLKRTNPEMLIGQRPLRTNFNMNSKASILGMTWSGFDFAYPEVRQFLRNRIETICRKYDWDGVELDFIRMPVFFKLGEIEQNIPTMTGFISEVRALLDKIGQERGRPYPLAVHVPDAPKYCLRCGLDINTWLANGLVDMVIIGTAYRPHVQTYGEFTKLCHYYGVPAYLCLNASLIHTNNILDPKYIPEAFRSRVSSLWLEDIDGIQLFNFFGLPPVHYGELKRVDHAEKLVGLDKLYDAGLRRVWVDRDILAAPVIRPRVVDSQPLLLKVGDPISRLAHEGKLKELRLRVRVADLYEDEEVEIRLNGHLVKITEHYAEPRKRVPGPGFPPPKGRGYWFEAIIDAPPLRQGLNYVLVSPGKGCLGSAASTVENVQLWVRHK